MISGIPGVLGLGTSMWDSCVYVQLCGVCGPCFDAFAFQASLNLTLSIVQPGVSMLEPPAAISANVGSNSIVILHAARV